MSIIGLSFQIAIGFDEIWFVTKTQQILQDFLVDNCGIVAYLFFALRPEKISASKNCQEPKTRHETLKTLKKLFAFLSHWFSFPVFVLRLIIHETHTHWAFPARQLWGDQALTTNQKTKQNITDMCKIVWRNWHLNTQKWDMHTYKSLEIIYVT